MNSNQSRRVETARKLAALGVATFRPAFGEDQHVIYFNGRYWIDTGMTEPVIDRLDRWLGENGVSVEWLAILTEEGAYKMHRCKFAGKQYPGARADRKTRGNMAREHGSR